MGEVLRIKHLIWTIGGMLVFAFGLGMNVNSKLSQVEKNKESIENIEIKLNGTTYIIQKNQTVIIKAITDLTLELKLALKDKKDRE